MLVYIYILAVRHSSLVALCQSGNELHSFGCEQNCSTAKFDRIHWLTLLDVCAILFAMFLFLDAFKVSYRFCVQNGLLSSGVLVNTPSVLLQGRKSFQPSIFASIVNSVTTKQMSLTTRCGACKHANYLVYFLLRGQ